MERKTMVIVLLVAFMISLFTSAAAGAVAGVVAVRMSASELRRDVQSNNIPPAQAQPNPGNPANPAQPNLPNQRQPGPRQFGAGGALITEVVSGSPAEKGGLQVGDLVVAVGGQRLDATHSLDALIRQAKVGDTVDIQVRRAGQTQTLSVTLAASPDSAATPYLGVRFNAGNPAPVATPVQPAG